VRAEPNVRVGPRCRLPNDGKHSPEPSPAIATRRRATATRVGAFIRAAVSAVVRAAFGRLLASGCPCTFNVAVGAATGESLLLAGRGWDCTTGVCVEAIRAPRDLDEGSATATFDRDSCVQLSRGLDGSRRGRVTGVGPEGGAELRVGVAPTPSSGRVRVPVSADGAAGCLSATAASDKSLTRASGGGTVAGM
jgi:hypothetical protein